MSISFISTVLNEEGTIEKLLQSLLLQSKKPDEIIIVDGGSIDDTVDKMENFQREHLDSNVIISVIKKTNRAEGRNEAIKIANGDIIAISDAGCELDKDWLKKIIQPFNKPFIDVVAGYYKSKTTNIFEKCVTSYVLSPPDKVNPQEFLPASRSMAFRRKTWENLGGFPINFSDNEDYVLANTMRKKRMQIFFAKDAIVYWYPRTNITGFFYMIYRFARGDTKAKLRYPKMISIFLRYIFLFFLALYFPLFYLLIGLTIYLLWAVWKNYKYVNHPLAFLYLPVFQVTSDIAVMAGFIRGRIL